MSAPATDTRPFALFEWMLALRYLRARRKEGFVSVIAGFSFLGILLGVATLIIVMAVMNGFRNELLGKILGLDGHVIVIRLDDPDFPDYEDYAKQLATAATVKHVVPLIETQVMASTPKQAVATILKRWLAWELPPGPSMRITLFGDFFVAAPSSTKPTVALMYSRRTVLPVSTSPHALCPDTAGLRASP